ncbi:MAG: ABC transporter substrate-binding protein [Saccharofermentanales bacterium]
MIKFRKFLAIFAAAIMLTSVLYGCKPAPTTTSGTSSETVSEASSNEESGESSEDVSGESSESTASSEITSGESSTATSGTSSTSQSTTQSTASTVSGKSSATTSVDNSIKFPGRVKNLNGRTIILNYPQVVSTKPLDGPARMLRKWKAIEKAYNCKIVQDTTISESANNTTIKASVLAGKPKVDIWYQNGYNKEFLPHYTSGTIQPLDDLRVIDFTDRTKYSESTELSKINGKYYGVCFSDYGIVGVTMTFFNKKYLTDCGITDDLYTVQNSGQWTWTKFFDYCKKVTLVPGKTAIFDSDGMLYDQIMYSYGTDYVDRDANGKAIFGGGSANGLAALALYTDMVKNKYVIIPVGGTQGGTNYSGFWGVGGTAPKSFIKSETAFAATQYMMMEYGVKAYGDASVKANYGMLFQPKRNLSDPYVCYSDATAVGFYAIPYGVKKPAEVATIIDALQSPSPNAAEAADDLKNEDALRKQSYDVQYADALNSVTGDDMVELKFKMVDMYVAKKFKYKFTFLGNGPGVSKDWIEQVAKIANGTANAGTVISSVTSNYNSKLKNLFVIR